jgi:hypothetical protein
MRHANHDPTQLALPRGHLGSDPQKNVQLMYVARPPQKCPFWNIEYAHVKLVAVLLPGYFPL